MQLQPMSRVAPFVAAVTGAGASPFSPAPVPSEADAPPRVLPNPWMLIRRLGTGDRAALAGHLISLPPEDRCARFGGPSTDDVIRRHCDALDLEETVCSAALDEAGRVVAAALGFP